MPSQRIYNFTIPKNFSSNLDGYEFLSNISIKTYDSNDSVVVFDFLSNELFDNNLCSPFGALIEDLKNRNNVVTLYGLNENVETGFKKNGFFQFLKASFTQEQSYVPKIDYKKFSLVDTNIFQKYINEQLLSLEDLPNMSDLLKKKINKSILEIFNNAHTHGLCEYVFTSGEFSEKEKKLRFTIADLGKTIRKNVNEYFNSGNKLGGKDCIKWAVEEGHTTKKGNIPGGLGLSLIREFLRLNKGGIQIISSNGYWEEKNGSIFEKDILNRFLGTIVTLEFNLNDNKSYVMTSELNPKNVL